MLVKSDQYIPEAKVSKPTKSGTMVISVMPTYKIIWFLLKRHRVGLLTTGNLVLLGFVFHVDRAVRLFI